MMRHAIIIMSLGLIFLNLRLGGESPALLALAFWSPMFLLLIKEERKFTIGLLLGAFQFPLALILIFKTLTPPVVVIGFLLFTLVHLRFQILGYPSLLSILYLLPLSFLVPLSQNPSSLTFLGMMGQLLLLLVLAIALQTHPQSPLSPLRLKTAGVAGILLFTACLAGFGLFRALPLPQSNAPESMDPNGGFSKSGLSREFILAGGGTIFTDPTPILRLEGEPPEYLRWQTYSRFNGLEWQPTPGIPRIPIATDGILLTPMGDKPRQSLKYLTLSFLDYPHSNVPAPYFLHRIWPPERYIFQSNYENDIFYRNPQPLTGKVLPIAYFDPLESPTGNRDRPLSPRLLARYLRLPPLSDRVIRLAIEWTQDLPGPVEKGRAILRILSRDYDYSLEANISSGQPLEEFLFAAKMGHCEFFATAMAILARVVGIPARVVKGYHGQDSLRYPGKWVVRNSHAHAWAELYLDGEWRVFDATPPSRPTHHRFNQNQGLWRTAFDWLDIWWSEEVVHFAGNPALNLPFGDPHPSTEWEPPETPANPLSIGEILKIKNWPWMVSLLLVAGILWRRNSARLLPRIFYPGGESPSDGNEDCGEILATWRKIGWIRSPDLTLRQFFTRCAAGLPPDSIPLDHWDILEYLEGRLYGDRGKEPDKTKKIENYIFLIKKITKRRDPRPGAK